MQRILIPFVFALLACACYAQPQQAEVVAQPEHQQPPAPLRYLLSAFAADTGKDWKTYEGLHGVTWLDTKSEYAAGRFARRGKLKLSGFGTAKLPDGGVGIGANARTASEGEAGITLGGTEQAVHNLSVTKFYATADLKVVLEQQLANAAVVRIAHNCQLQDESESNRAFYEIAMAGGSRLYAETMVVEGGKYGPEQTVMSFQRDDPEARITQFRCSE